MAHVKSPVDHFNLFSSVSHTRRALHIFLFPDRDSSNPTIGRTAVHSTLGSFFRYASSTVEIGLPWTALRIYYSSDRRLNRESSRLSMLVILTFICHKYALISSLINFVVVFGKFARCYWFLFIWIIGYNSCFPESDRFVFWKLCLWFCVNVMLILWCGGGGIVM